MNTGFLKYLEANNLEEKAMARLSSNQLLLLNLKGEIDDRDRDRDRDRDFMPQDRALAELRELTGQDFGLDANLWEKWLSENNQLTYPTDHGPPSRRPKPRPSE